MKNIVLLTHGDFAKGIVTSLHLVLGEVENLDWISITARETIPEIVQMIEEKIQGFCNEEPTVILTDIAGGSTTQAAMQLLVDERKIYLIAGLNLGLLLEVALLPMNGADQENKILLRQAVENSRQVICFVNDRLEQFEEQDEEAGEL